MSWVPDDVDISGPSADSGAVEVDTLVLTGVADKR
jgi:hypothetical protein